jgi:hypothetical protein
VSLPDEAAVAPPSAALLELEAEPSVAVFDRNPRLVRTASRSRNSI